ncbi:hypothetical protein C789_111 [Microcystis aeruginosa FACHB-905 = DIANCHI905]|nr:hypothetical protein C789_111 [Microcystis aeruginosa FACHB-905 = DIANCHI905]
MGRLSELYHRDDSRKKSGSYRFCVISLTYNMIDQSLCPLCLCGSFHPLARRNVS